MTSRNGNPAIQFGIWLSFILVGLTTSSIPASATEVSFKVVDTSSQAAIHVLVILQDLRSHQSEVFRALTDKQGRIPACQLEPVLYGVLATDPYGIWRTEVREFIVGSEPAEIVTTVQPLETHGSRDVVAIGARQLSMKFGNTTEVPHLVFTYWYETAPQRSNLSIGIRPITRAQPSFKLRVKTWWLSPYRATTW